MNRYLVKIFRELLFALVITLSVTSCSENSYDSAIATRKTILVYMIANNSLSSYADENIDSMLLPNLVHFCIHWATTANSHR